MALYEDLDAMYPNHTHYYTVSLSDMNEAMEKCARLAGYEAHVVTYNGQMILVSQQGFSSDNISWLNEIAPPPAPEVIEAPKTK
jgi:hypothetical protein